MSDFDLVLRNARIIDGTGAPERTGDVAVRGDRIAAVGQVSGRGARELDVRGRVVAPGFIDIHTHYDPQICWDRLATPSLEHGVTTVVMGNCSLSLAPVKPDGAEKLVAMFSRIEDIKAPTFEAGVPFTWESFGEYLAHIGQGLGPNVGALVGHSALRYYVMGKASQERVASDAEIAAMCGLLEAAMQAGAIGLSTSYVDIDENMVPVPSRWADERERLALCQAMARSGRGVLQTVPYFIDIEEQLKNIAELGRLSRGSGVLCSLAPIVSSPVNAGAWRRSLAALEHERELGGRVYAQSMPRTFDLNMRLSETSFLLYGLPLWNRFMGLPLAERIQAFGDPAHRQSLVEEGMRIAPLLMAASIGETFSQANRPLAGRSLLQLAGERGKPLPEVMLEVALADGLQTEFCIRGVIHADVDSVAEILSHPRVHIGASDAGAHIAQFCGAGDTCYLIERFVRQYKRMSLEQAVHRLTGELARDWGIAERGEIAVGKFADLVVFDPETIARGPERFVADVPGDANRYVRDATGIDAVIVNGAVTLERGHYTEARAGRIV
ncbi:MAG TPA: D-aminoacylase [Myxococcota bacterium]|nr:D-aminoacylase [Myxococcota bacterium]